MSIDRHRQARSRRDAAIAAVHAAMASARDDLRAAERAFAEARGGMPGLEASFGAVMRDLEARSAEARTILDVATRVSASTADAGALKQQLDVARKLLQTGGAARERLARIAALIAPILTFRCDVASLDSEVNDAHTIDVESRHEAEAASMAEDETRRALDEGRETLVPLIEEFRRAAPLLERARARRALAEAELQTLREEVAVQQEIVEQTVVAPNVMAELNARREQLRMALADEQLQADAEAAQLEEKRGRLRDIKAMQEELVELARVYDGRCSSAQTAPPALDFDLIASYFADVVVPEDRQSGGAR